MISGGAGGGSFLLQIKEDDKFCARLLSKETSLANSSFRVYYGVAAAGSVPFRWESRPGTPKHTTSAAVLPPLTPPPCYHFSSPRSRIRSAKKPAGSKSSFLSLPRLLALKKATVGGGPAPSMSPSSSLSQSSSSSFLSSSSSYSPRSDHHRRPSGDDEAEFSGGGSLASTLCFGMRIFLAKKNALAQSTG
ncbi:uncharacterized protein LOC121974472 [Zingiber officinale]|uniref:Uncharacterized protein n=1 Tax=Zingiber officinale TaxID=94328 RepID=A0A8J5GN30_ZINOF|nr:uncharacterized protein LOC121974472 [Zingiber officinale]KAG6509557.1 hypothetical protein ZIOFF_027557 [Zingiber officinale]